MRRIVWTLAALAVLPSAALADSPRPNEMVLSEPVTPPPIGSLINSHILFLNNCRPNGCAVTVGTSSSLTDHSDLAQHSGTLTAFPTTISWASVLSCVQGVMAPFNITVTDVDPGTTTPHFEVMVAGQPTQIGLSNGFGGIADYLCGAPGQCSGMYYPNALVFAFAGNPGSDVTQMCGTAAQEIAHAWNLDHTTRTSDPMTYNQYATPLKFMDGTPCGSDCGYSCPGGGNNCNSFGVTCSGSNTHPCMETNTATQDEVKIITALFGPAGAKVPVVAITSPATGSAVQTGMTFPVTATCMTDDGIQELDLSIDGIEKASLTTSPANFVGPNTLTEGTHHITVLCGTNLQATASASIDIVVGSLCSQDSDCPTNDICYQKACIAGPAAPNGLGATCNGNSSCASGSCGNDGTQMLCVVPCDLSNDQCPTGFGCLDAGNNVGVCWLGADKSSSPAGCCDTRGDSRGSILLGVSFAAVLIRRRKAPNGHANRR